jgi:hypothetical protein
LTELHEPESAVSGSLRAFFLSMLSVERRPRPAGGGFAVSGRMRSGLANAPRSLRPWALALDGVARAVRDIEPRPSFADVAGGLVEAVLNR